MVDMSSNFDSVNEARKGTYWQPFTSNRLLRADPEPRMLTKAEGIYYTSINGTRLLDTLSGLWCTPLGHAHPRIAEAVKTQVETLDFAPSFQMTHPGAISLAERIAEMAPEGMNHVFFANSGS